MLTCVSVLVPGAMSSGAFGNPPVYWASMSALHLVATFCHVMLTGTKLSEGNEEKTMRWGNLFVALLAPRLQHRHVNWSSKYSWMMDFSSVLFEGGWVLPRIKCIPLSLCLCQASQMLSTRTQTRKRLEDQPGVPLELSSGFCNLSCCSCLCYVELWG